MNIRQLIENYGGRRFVLTLLTGATCVALLVHGYLTEAVFRDLIMATVAVYISANTFQKYSDNRNKYNKNSGDESNE